MRLFFALSLAGCLPAAFAALPVVDLGYSVHQATVNTSGNYYSFKNIRYAEPPLGDLRFAAPIAPQKINRSLNNGSVGGLCPQAYPNWLLTLQNLTAAELPTDPTTSEDCLFLDVVVPETIFNASSGVNGSTGAPVLVWLYGGGYVLGSKEGNPAGLILSSQQSGAKGVVYVALNYRLGMFGWLAGPTFQQNGTANAALYDQRLALAWVQQYIHLFGGDPNRVTVLGESAGAGSIMHQLTAFGGKSKAPFQQAILQSPGWVPITSPYQEETLFNKVLAAANVTSLQSLRTLSSAQLIAANSAVVGDSTYGFFTFGPAVDGNIATALPATLMLHGQFDSTVKLLLGHNSHEGLLYTAPSQNDSTFATVVHQVFPDISQTIFDYVTQTLYPPVYDGSYGYTSAYARTVLFWSEIRYVCNTGAMARAYGNQTYDYQFSVPPGSHGQDVPYTFYNGPTAQVLNTTVALTLQSWITTFAETGTPSAPGLPAFPRYGASGMAENLNITNINPIVDPNTNPRCAFWQKSLFY